MAIFDISQYHSGNKKHQFYAETVRQYNDIKTHALGEYPKELISERRPGESDTIKRYREKIYIPKTQASVTKVFNSLQKIRKSQDYLIAFDETVVPAMVIREERPSYYLTDEFPKYGSLDNWFWSVCFSQYLMDANAVVMVVPTNVVKESNEYFKPYPMLFNSPQVLDYVYGEYAILKSIETSSYKSGNRSYPGAVYYSADKESIVKYEQINAKGDFTATEFLHGLGYVPVLKTYGVIVRDTPEDTLYSSRIHSMVPSLNEAAREWSDLQAEVVQHIHSTMWAIQGKECNACHGTGMTPKPGSSPIMCNDCNGKGFFPFNPYEHITVKPASLGDPGTPIPPAGYLTKPIDIAKLQDQRVHDHIYHALSSLNMEFLAAVPLSQSGTAKEVDRAELNNFVYSIAEDCVRILDEISEMVIDYRYGGIVPDYEQREKLRPMISVPEKYDIIPEGYLVDEISKLRTAKVSPLIINAAELEYAAKKFNTNRKIKEKLQDIYELDPLAGMSADEILVAVSNGVINKRTQVIHSNIREFVDMAHDQNPEFYQLSMMEKKAVINTLADGWLNENRPRTMMDVQPTDTNPADDQPTDNVE
jgi:hypothetical protein